MIIAIGISVPEVLIVGEQVLDTNEYLTDDDGEILTDDDGDPLTED